jgi:predicted DNA binding protein
LKCSADAFFMARPGSTGMREMRLRLSLPDGDLHDWGGAYGMGELCPLAVYRVEALADGTVVAVVTFDGDSEVVRERLEGDDAVLSASITGDHEGLFQVQFEPRETVRQMLEMRRETPVVMQLPMYLNADGSATATFYGDQAEFGKTVEYVPDEVDVEIVHIRDVTAAERSVFDRLTDRQREVLDVAIEAGYYDDPRGATHAELAADLDVSPTTVSEHLRRIERRVFGAYADGRHNR